MEQVSLSLAHTVFLPKNAEPISTIENIECSGEILGRSKSEGIVSLNGEVAVNVEYISQSGDDIRQTLNFPWQEEMPAGFSGFDVDEMKLEIGVLDYQILLDDAFEVMMNLHISSKEKLGSPNLSSGGRSFARKFAELSSVDDDADEPVETLTAAELYHNSTADIVETDAASAEPTTAQESTAVMTEEVAAVSAKITEEAAVQSAYESAELSADTSVDMASQAEALTTTAEAAGDMELTEANSDLEFAEADAGVEFAEAEDAAAMADEAAAAEEAVSEADDDAPAHITYAESSPRPWATTETVGNEYRMRFYLVQTGEDLDSIARKHNVSGAALSEVNSLAGENVRSGMVLSIPDGE